MLPSVKDFKELKDDLEFKATEADRAKETLETLETDKGKLNKDFQKLEQLETKINTEMVCFYLIYKLCFKSEILDQDILIKACCILQYK